MNGEPPIPAEIWARLRAFLERGVTGSAVLHVAQGSVKAIELTEHIRAPGSAR